MNTEVPRSKVISVALFFTFMSILLLLSLYVTGGLEGIVGTKDTIHVAFHESVTGLRNGSPVTLSGVNVGRVETIRPMTSETARRIVRDASVITQNPRDSSQDAPNRIIPGKRFLSTRNPLVLVSMKVQEDAIPLNKKTHVSLITTDFTASQSVRFSAGASGTSSELAGKTVVLSAEQSPLGRLRSRFLGKRDGVLRKRNIKNLNKMIENLKKMSEQLTRITGKRSERKIDKLLESHMNVASRLDEWVRDRPLCPGSNEPANVEKITEEGTTKYRYTCPGSDQEWIRDHPPKPGRVTRVVTRLDKLLKRLNRLMSDRGRKASIPRLVSDVSRLSDNLNETSRSMNRLIEENRTAIRKLLRNVNHLSKKIDSVFTQLEQDPSSAVFGRRGKEIRSPYSK